MLVQPGHEHELPVPCSCAELLLTFRLQQRFFAREPADGTQGLSSHSLAPVALWLPTRDGSRSEKGFKRFYEQVQEYKADESRLSQM